MSHHSMKSTLAMTVSTALLATMLATPTYAQSSDTSVITDEIITACHLTTHWFL